MDLKKRLANLDRLTRKPQPAPPASEQGLAMSPAEIATDVLGLEETSTPSGACYQGHHSERIACPAGDLPDLNGFFSHPGTAPLCTGDIVFLDTETTGLVGGTGTIAFLVGVSWWEQDEFRTRQFFLCGPGGEAAMMSRLHDLARKFRAVVTFNGASFDLPLLKTRALLNRLDHPWDGLLSWDLLVPCRRLWGRRLPNCRQQTVEAGICGLLRDERDIAGHLIPQTWFDFLQLGQVGDLQRVLHHNRRDMVGMAHIFLAAMAMARTLTGRVMPDSFTWQDAWALGRTAERRASLPESLHWMDQARRVADSSGEKPYADPRFVADTLRIIKRGGNWPVVENVIARALDCGQNDGWLHREAAILFEHRLTDLERAVKHALAADDEHRLLRLQRKLKHRQLREETP